MSYAKLVGGPTGDQVRIALAGVILSPSREPARLPFVVDDGPEGKPNPVEREFAVCGFHDYNGGRDGAMALLLPIIGPDAPEKPTRLIFYPNATGDHVGHVEVYDDKEEGSE